MNSAKIDFNTIENEEAFHTQNQKTFGFPDFYGANMHAWIDCMRSLRHPEDGLSTFHVSDGVVLALLLQGYSEFDQRNPEFAQRLLYCIGLVNQFTLSVDGMVLIAHCIE